MALATTVMAATAATNPFFDYKNWKTPHGTYPFNEIHAEHYMPAFEEAMKRGLQDIDNIVNNPAAPTFANTIEAYEASGEMLSIVAGCFYNLAHSETNDTIQQIEMELSPKMSEYSSSIRLNEGLFKRIKAVYEQRDKLKLNKAQYKLLEDIYESFANNGANLSPEDKEKYRQMTAKLSQLTLQYGQNVLKATNAWTMLITDEAQLAGLNDDVKSMLRGNAEKKGLEGWLLDLKPTTYIPVMEDLDNRDIRRELYTARNARCIGGEFDNTGIIVEIVNTRLALANLFDKKNYADKSLYKTMAETPENVYKLLDQLRDAYMPAARAEQQHETAEGGEVIRAELERGSPCRGKVERLLEVARHAVYDLVAAVVGLDQDLAYAQRLLRRDVNAPVRLRQKRHGREQADQIGCFPHRHLRYLIVTQKPRRDIQISPFRTPTLQRAARSDAPDTIDQPATLSSPDTSTHVTGSLSCEAPDGRSLTSSVPSAGRVKP